MQESFGIGELIIVVAADNHSLTVLSSDFLKASSIIAEDWEPAGPSSYAMSPIQMLFTNRVRISAQPRRIEFAEKLVDEASEEVQVPGVAIRFVERFPFTNYTGVGVNLRGHLVAETEEDARRFIVERLIAPSYRTIMGTPAEYSVSFGQEIEGGLLNVTIGTGQFSSPSGEELPVVAFDSNFHRNITAEQSEEKIAYIRSVVQEWRSDLDRFRTLVEKTFLT